MSEARHGGCERVRGRLDRLLDGGLGALEAARDEGHLEACDVCRRERAGAERVLALLREPADGLELAREGLDARLAAARAPRGRAPLPRVEPGVEPGAHRPRLLRSAVLQAALTVAAGLLALFALDLADLDRDVELRRPRVDAAGLLDARWLRALESVWRDA